MEMETQCKVTARNVSLFVQALQKFCLAYYKALSNQQSDGSKIGTWKKELAVMRTSFIV